MNMSEVNVTLPGIEAPFESVSIVREGETIRVHNSQGELILERGGVDRVARVDRRTFVVYFADGTQGSVWKSRGCCSGSV